MTNIVIGTAGHIDHGKTTLIKTLTGIETDTTKEEKTRGLSINLGFAYLDLPTGQRVGIVDVPGHEKFIKNMVAGLPGLSLILLVVDAAEGIMPQTKEHIDILTLLGVRNFIIVLTKVATVDSEMKELVVDDIREQLAGTILEAAPLIETDALAGVGLPALLEAIAEKVQTINQPNAQIAPRLNVDRVFSVKGFGTVVTGTLIEGELKLGDELQCLPSKKKTKVRNIQVHDTDVERVVAGQRTALNLANLKHEEIARGDVLTLEGNLEPTWMIDAKLTYLAKNKESIGLWERVRLLIGTTEVMARTVTIGAECIKPGGEGFVQFRLEEVVAVKPGDRFVVRAYSPVETIGGGVVLEANPTKHRRFNQQVIESLTVKDQGSLEEVLTDFMKNTKQAFLSGKEAATYLDHPFVEVAEMLIDLEKKGAVKSFAGMYLHQGTYVKLASVISAVLAEYHKVHRLRKGMPLEEFRSKSQLGLTNKELECVLSEMEADKLIISQQHQLALADFEVIFNKYHLVEKERFEKALLKSGYVAVKAEGLTANNQNAQEVLEALTDDTVVFLTHEYIIHADYIKRADTVIREIIDANGLMTLADFRDRTNSSRKASMLLLEHMDKIGLTKRVENTRVLN